MAFTLTLKVTPAVRKYLLVHLGDNYKLSETDPVGLHLHNLLRQPLPARVRYTKWVKKHQTSSFEVSVTSERLFKERCSNLSDVTHHRLNSFVEKILKTELHTFVENHREFGLSQHGAITTLMRKYNLDDSDITFDALKKSCQRFREGQKKNKYVTGFCPPLSIKKGLHFVPFSQTVAA